MHRFQLAVATRCLELPLRNSLQVAADCGAEGVQFDLRQELPAGELNDSGRRDLLHFLEELGLKVAGTTFTLRRALTDEHELDRRVAALKQAMTWSFGLHSRVLSFRIGKLPTEPDGKEAQTLRDVLDDLARHANHVGVVLAIQPSQDSAEDLLKWFTSVTTGPIGIDFDPAQFVLAKRDPVAALRTLHAFTYHAQLRDAMSELDGTSNETVVGDGAVPWPEVLATLGEIEFSGWLTAVRNQGQDKPGDLARAISYVRRLLLGG